jgi:Kdo2-lipid IVA lauroyltransferase/acyltransferase
MTDYLVYFLFISLERTVPLFPLSFIRLLAGFYGYVFYYFIPVRKDTAFGNLKLAFPEKSSGELKNILKAAYVNIFTVIFEFFYFRKFKRERLEKAIRVTNLEIIHEKLKEGKGLMLISAHFGNWELGAFGLSQLCDEPIHVIVKEQSNKLINKRINKIRELNDNKMIDMEKGLKYVLMLLRENKIVAMLSDQYAPGQDTVRIKFFADNVPAYEGAARIALHTQAIVLFGVPVRQKDGNYELTLQEIDTRKYSVNTEDNIKKLTQEHTDLLIACIRKNPEQWLWFHRRFKYLSQSRPPAERADKDSKEK